MRIRTADRKEKEVSCRRKRNCNLSQEECFSPRHIDPETVMCAICGKPLVDAKRIKRKIRKIKKTGSVSESDVNKIERAHKDIGWRYILNELYVHVRCSERKCELREGKVWKDEKGKREGK